MFRRADGYPLTDTRALVHAEEQTTTDPLNHTTSFGYDSAGNLTTITTCSTTRPR